MIKKLFLLLILFLINNLVNSSSNSNSNSISLNPWNVNDRDLLYTILINSTNVPIFGNDNSNNCLHGLQIQLHWQNRTGRLELLNGSLNIKPTSWWGNMNYFLSVIPYLSAMNNGLVPNVTLAKASGTTQNSVFCTTYNECDESVMSNWDKFFIEIKNIQGNSSLIGNDQYLLKLMWDAHIGSIGKASELFSSTTLNLLPSAKEKKFGNGWAHFVDIIAIVNFNTNYSQVTMLGENLPPRLLSFFDIPPFISSFTKNQNNIVATMFSIDDLSKSTIAWNLFITLLKKVTSNNNCLLLINNEIESFISSPTSTFLKILIDVLTNKC